MRKPDEFTDYDIKKEFTNREYPRNLFWEWYGKAVSNMDDFFVLSYYGIGGIGKSRLLNQLCRELSEDSKLYVKYDFESAKGLDPCNVLLGLKQTTRNKYGDVFRFPLMNAALLMMAKKSDLDFTNDELVRSIISESPYFELTVDALEMVPVVGAPANFAIKLFSQLKANLENLADKRDLKVKYKLAISEMDYLEADELRKKIPRYFHIDMAENMRHLAMPLVIFLDTYEKFIDTFKDSSNIILDNWLWDGPQSLIQRIPGILWVISGRDKLTWADSGEWDSEHLTCLEVHDFSDSDSIRYLNAAGIIDDRIVSHICTITKGVPIYLELCVDTYYLLKSQGKEPIPENFEVDQRKIANRYVKYLDHVNRTLVYMLAAMGSWRDDEADYIGKKNYPGIFTLELYNSIIKHSFIKTEEDGKRRMHGVVVDSLLSEINMSTLNTVNADLFHFRIMKIDTITSSRDTLSAVDDAVSCFCRISGSEIYKEQYSDFRRLTSKIIEILRSGLIYDSLSLSTKLKEHCAMLFPDTDYYAESLLIQGSSLSAVGNYEQALENEELSYSLRRTSLGIDHPDTLNNLHSLGATYGDLGRFDEARSVLEQVYNAMKSTFGEDHPDTINSLHSLGAAYRDLGRFDQATTVFEQVYEAMKRTLGEDHPDTINSLHSLGAAYRDLGRFDQATTVFEKVYEAMKRTLGENHPDTLNSLHSLGAAYSNLRRFDQALTVFEQVYNAMKSTLGEEHPDTLNSLHSIGLTYCKLERFDLALTVFEQVYNATKSTLGEEHPDTLRSLHSIGLTYCKLERFDQALPAFDQVYKARKCTLGENHLDTLNSLHSIGLTYCKLERFDQALTVFEQVYNAMKSTLGEEHPDTLRSLHNLGTAYNYLGHSKKALAVKEKVYEARKHTLGEEYPDTLRSLHNLGAAYSNLGRFDQARTIFEQVYEAMKRTLGEDHPDTLNSLHSLGATYNRLGRFDQARTIFEQVYEARKRTLGEEHPDTVRTKEIYNLVKSLSEET